MLTYKHFEVIISSSKLAPMDDIPFVELGPPFFFLLHCTDHGARNYLVQTAGLFTEEEFTQELRLSSRPLPEIEVTVTGLDFVPKGEHTGCDEVKVHTWGSFLPVSVVCIQLDVDVIWPYIPGLALQMLQKRHRPWRIQWQEEFIGGPSTPKQPMLDHCPEALRNVAQSMMTDQTPVNPHPTRPLSGSDSNTAKNCAQIQHCISDLLIDSARNAQNIEVGSDFSQQAQQYTGLKGRVSSVKTRDKVIAENSAKNSNPKRTKGGSKNNASQPKEEALPSKKFKEDDGKNNNQLRATDRRKSNEKEL